MTEKRKAQFCDEVLDFATELLHGYELYEWVRLRGMTDEEVQEEFHFEDDEMEEYREEYKNSFLK